MYEIDLCFFHLLAYSDASVLNYPCDLRSHWSLCWVRGCHQPVICWDLKYVIGSLKTETKTAHVLFLRKMTSNTIDKKCIIQGAKTTAHEQGTPT